MKLWAMPCRATQDRQVIVENSHKTWSVGGGNGKPLQYSCCENPMNSMIRQKDFNGHESKKTPGDGKGQQRPVCCSPWGGKESDTTQRLNNKKEVPKKLKTELPYDPATPLLGIYPEKNIILKDTCSLMFISALTILWLAEREVGREGQIGKLGLVTNKDLLYRTGNSTQYSITIYVGKELKKEWRLYIYTYICIYNWFTFCTAKSNTTLQITINQ